MKARIVWIFILLMGFSIAQAHIASNGFLMVRVDGREITGSLELTVRDVELAIGVDANRDGKVTWGELRAAEPQFVEYVNQHLSINSEGSPCKLNFQGVQINDRVDGNYAWLPFKAICPLVGSRLSIDYALMEGVDPSHRGLLTLTAGDIVQTAVLGGSAARADFSVLSPSRWRTFVEYLQAGV